MLTRRNVFLGGGTLALVGAGAAYAVIQDMGSLDQYEAAVAVTRATLAQMPEIGDFLRYATLAPSGHNTQPWKFRLNGNQITMLPDLVRRTPIVDPDDHHLFVSLGCAAENLSLACGARGRQGELRFDPSNDGAAVFEFNSAVAAPSPLFDAIPKRQSSRCDYDGKVVSSVLQHNRKDAWEPCLPTDLDSANERSKAQARRAWLELLMFPKCVLRTHKRGQRAQQAYHVAKALLLRWKAGERLSLWCEIPESTGARKKGISNAAQARQEQVDKLVGLGRLSQALQRLTSPGLAENTAQVRAKLLAKFPPCPCGRPEGSSALPPPPEEIEATSVAKAIRSFKAGAGPGPNGLRSDFLKQCLGADDEPIYCLCSGTLLSSWRTGKPPRGCERGSVGEPSSAWAKEAPRLRMTRAPS